MVTPDNPKNKHKLRVIPKEFLVKRLQTGYAEINDCYEGLKKHSKTRISGKTHEIVVKLNTDIAAILKDIPARGIHIKKDQEMLCSSVQSLVTKAKEDISALIKASDKVASSVQNIIRTRISEVLSNIRSEITEKFEVKGTDGNLNVAIATTAFQPTIIPNIAVVPRGFESDQEYEESDIIDTRNLINKSELLSQHFELVVFGYFKQILEKVFNQIKLKIVSEKKRFCPKFTPVSIQEFNVLFNFADNIKNSLKEILPELISLYFSKVDEKLIVNDTLSVVFGINDVVFKEAESLCNDLEGLDIEMQPLFVKRILEGSVLELDDVICAVNNNVLPDEQDSAFDTTDIIINGLIYSQIPVENQKDTLQWLEEREMDETEKDIIKEKLIVLKITNGSICHEKIAEITDYINEQMYCGLPIRNPEQIQKYIAGMAESVEEITSTDIEICAITGKPEPEMTVETAQVIQPIQEPEPAEFPAVVVEPIQEPAEAIKPATLIVSEPEHAELEPIKATVSSEKPVVQEGMLSTEIQNQVDSIISWFENLPDPIHKKLYWKIADFFYAQLKNNAKNLPLNYLILYLRRFQLLKKYYSPKANSFSVPDKDINSLFEIPGLIKAENIEPEETITQQNEEQKLVGEISAILAKSEVSADRIKDIQNTLLEIQKKLELLTASNKDLSEKILLGQKELEIIENSISALKAEIQSIAASEDFDSELLKQKIDEAQRFKNKRLELEKDVMNYQKRIIENEEALNTLMEQLKNYQEDIESEGAYSKKRADVLKGLKTILKILKK